MEVTYVVDSLRNLASAVATGTDDRLRGAGHRKRQGHGGSHPLRYHGDGGRLFLPAGRRLPGWRGPTRGSMPPAAWNRGNHPPQPEL